LRFKLDENLGLAVKDFLLARGHDALRVREQGLGALPDPTLFPIVSKENRVLVTLDRGFGNYHFYQPGTHPGIIVLRPLRRAPPSVIALLGQLLNVVSEERLSGAVVIASRQRIRIFSPRGGIGDVAK
jgi:predicted nuclease of predicted toxin-antitoxin system